MKNTNEDKIPDLRILLPQLEKIVAKAFKTSPTKVTAFWDGKKIIIDPGSTAK